MHIAEKKLTMFVRRIVGWLRVGEWEFKDFLYRALSLCLWKLGLILGWNFSPFSLALTLLRSFQLAIFCLRLIASYFKEWIVTTSQEKSIMLRLLVVLHKLFRSLRCFFSSVDKKSKLSGWNFGGKFLAENGFGVQTFFLLFFY